MNTFTLYGSEYPLDGQHAELMAQYLAPPSVSDKWTLIRDWADSRQVSADDMLCLLQAIDTGAANIMLGGQFKTASDLDQIASKLGIDTTTEEEQNMNNATETKCSKAMTGESAINYAELHGLMLSKHADPIEGHRADLSPDEAREIAKEDPSLIYLEVNAYHQPTGPMTFSG